MSSWGTVYELERAKATGNDPESLRHEIARLRGWTRLADAAPPKELPDHMGGERWFLTWHEPTGTYDVACIERDLSGGYDFGGFALGVTHWREITNDHPR